MRKALALVLSLGLTAIWTAPAAAAPTRVDYVAQADPICLATAQSESTIAAAAVTDVNKGRFKAAAHELRRAGHVFGGGVDQLAALERPPADAPLLGAWIDSLRAQLPILRRFARALNRTQVKRIRQTARRLILAEEKTSALVDDYGFAFCGEFGA